MIRRVMKSRRIIKRSREQVEPPPRQRRFKQTKPPVKQIRVNIVQPEINITKGVLNKFFIVGPPRTGTTIMSRCIDDHPDSICLFESHIEKAAFGCPITRSHTGRMKNHGFTKEQTINLISKVRDSASYINWYDECAKILNPLYHKQATYIGDVVHACPSARKTIQLFPKILTVRDPRAVSYSGKQNYLQPYLKSLQASLPYLDETTLIIKFEDFISEPEKTMDQVYRFLNLPYDDSFMNRTKKPYDRRFRFNPNATHMFDVSIINKWESSTKPIYVPRNIKDLAAKFGYFLPEDRSRK